MKQPHAIQRQGKATAEVIDALEKEGQPAILNGKHLDWRALREWSIEFLEREYGDLVCPAYLDMPTSGPLAQYRNQDFAREITLREFLRHSAQARTPCYIRQLPLKRARQVKADFDFAQITPKASYKASTNIWIGSPRTKSTLHWDTPNNLLMQVRGVKHCTLFAPADTKFLYPYADQLRLSRLDPLTWDRRAFPLVAEAQPYIGALHEGELLFLPMRWWHFMHQDDYSIALSNWYGDECATSYFFEVASQCGWNHMLRPLRDFFYCGLLRQAFVQKLSSDVPTGVYLYELFRIAMKRRLWSRERTISE